MNDVIKNLGDIDAQRVLQDPDYKAGAVTPDTENGKKVAESQMLLEQIQAIFNSTDEADSRSKKTLVSLAVPVDKVKERMKEVIFWDVEKNDSWERVVDTRMWEGEFEKRVATMILAESMPAIEELTLPLRNFLTLNKYVTDLQISPAKTEFRFKYFGEVCDISLKDLSTYINGEEESHREQVIYDLQCIVFEKLLSYHIDLIHLSPLKDHSNCFALDEKIQDVFVEAGIIRDYTPNTMSILDTSESTWVIFYHVDQRFGYQNFDPKKYKREKTYNNIEEVLKKLSQK